MPEQETLSPDYNYVERSIGLTIYSHIPFLNFLFPLFAFIHGLFQVRNYALFNRVVPKMFPSLWITLRMTTIRIVYAAILNVILILLFGVNPFGWMIETYLELFRIGSFFSQTLGWPPVYDGSGSGMEYLMVMLVLAATYYGYAVLGALYGIGHYRRVLKTRFEEIKGKEQEQKMVTTEETI